MPSSFRDLDASMLPQLMTSAGNLDLMRVLGRPGRGPIFENICLRHFERGYGLRVDGGQGRGAKMYLMLCSVALSLETQKSDRSI
jgi:hypothetical protein